MNDDCDNIINDENNVKL